MENGKKRGRKDKKKKEDKDKKYKTELKNDGGGAPVSSTLGNQQTDLASAMMTMAHALTAAMNASAMNAMGNDKKGRRENKKKEKVKHKKEETELRNDCGGASMSSTFGDQQTDLASAMMMMAHALTAAMNASAMKASFSTPSMPETHRRDDKLSRNIGSKEEIKPDELSSIQQRDTISMRDIMDSSWSKAVQRNREFLVNQIMPDSGIVNELYARAALSYENVGSIMTKKTVSEKNSYLLKCIEATGHYETLFQALRETNQTDIINHLERDRSDIMESSWSETVSRHRRFVNKRIEPKVSFLVEKLFTNRVLSQKAKDEIYAKETTYDMNSELLNYILANKKCAVFVVFLIETNQAHIVNYLENNGIYPVNADWPIRWPLVNPEKTILRDCHTKMIENLEVDEDGFLDRMYAKHALGPWQRQFILSQKTSYDRNITTLDMLRRRSIQDFYQTKRCLCDSDQIHIAKILQGGSEHFEVRAVYSFNPEDIGLNMEYSGELLIFNLLKLSEIAGANNRIADCLGFERGDQMEIFQQGYLGNTGRWSIARHSRTGELGHIPKSHVVIIYGGRNTFCRGVVSASKTTMNDIFLELIDIILLKSYLQLTSKKKFNSKNIIALLASVTYCWFQLVGKRKFKRRACQHLKNFYSEGDRLHTHMERCNRSYIENSIRLTGIIRRLKSSDCITDVQAILLTRKSNCTTDLKMHQRDDVPDLLSIMRSWDKKRRSTFIQCLLETNQKTVAQILDHGGAVLKADIRNLVDDRSCVSPSQPTTERLEIPFEAQKHASRFVAILTRQMKEYDTEILNIIQDQQETVWMWIRSIDGLLQLQKPETLSASVNGFRGASVINMDRSQLIKDIGIFPQNFHFGKRIAVKNNRPIEGVTKLGNKIYVLCGSLLVFDDDNKFRFEKEIKISNDIEPLDIASNEEDYCLYVTCSKSVWKITVDPVKENTEMIKWLSVEEDGQVIRSSHFSNNKILLMSDDCDDYKKDFLNKYGKDALPHFSLRLPYDILDPRRAVEMSTGNFIIGHKIEGTYEKCPMMWTLSEISRYGQIYRRFQPESVTQVLKDIWDISTDTYDNVFVAERSMDRVICLDQYLSWNNIIPVKPAVDEKRKKAFGPWRLYCDNEKKQLIVGGVNNMVDIYTRSVRRQT